MGASTDPSRTPEVTAADEDFFPSRITSCVRLLRKLFTYRSGGDLLPDGGGVPRQTHLRSPTASGSGHPC